LRAFHGVECLAVRMDAHATVLQHAFLCCLEVRDASVYGSMQPLQVPAHTSLLQTSILALWIVTLMLPLPCRAPLLLPCTPAGGAGGAALPHGLPAHGAGVCDADGGRLPAARHQRHHAGPVHGERGEWGVGVGRGGGGGRLHIAGTPGGAWGFSPLCIVNLCTGLCPASADHPCPCILRTPDAPPKPPSLSRFQPALHMPTH
jgi:hypothetical protein